MLRYSGQQHRQVAVCMCEPLGRRVVDSRGGSIYCAEIRRPATPAIETERDRSQYTLLRYSGQQHQQQRHRETGGSVHCAEMMLRLAKPATERGGSMHCVELHRPATPATETQRDRLQYALC